MSSVSCCEVPRVNAPSGRIRARRSKRPAPPKSAAPTWLEHSKGSKIKKRGQPRSRSLRGALRLTGCWSESARRRRSTGSRRHRRRGGVVAVSPSSPPSSDAGVIVIVVWRPQQLRLLRLPQDRPLRRSQGPHHNGSSQAGGCGSASTSSCAGSGGTCTCACTCTCTTRRFRTSGLCNPTRCLRRPSPCG